MPVGKRRSPSASVAVTLAEVLLGLLVGRIDEGQPAALGRRQPGLQALEAVTALHVRAEAPRRLHLRERAERRFERMCLLALQLDEHGAVLGAQGPHRQQRRTRIEVAMLELAAQLRRARAA